MLADQAILDELSVDQQDPASRVAIYFIGHARIIKAVIAAFYSAYPKVLKRSLHQFQAILSLLCSDFPTSLVIKETAAVSGSVQSARGVLSLFTFLRDQKALIEATVRDVYDDGKYATKAILHPLHARMHALAPLIARLEKYLAQGKLAKKSNKCTTVPAPPTLTRPRTPTMPEPVTLPALPKARAAPATTHLTTKTKDQLALDAGKRARRRARQQAVADGTLAAAVFHVAQRPTVSESTAAKLAALKAERDMPASARPAARPHAPGYAPRPRSAGNGGGKLNTAAILRETAVFQKREREEQQKIEQALRSLVDPLAVARMEEEARWHAQEEAKVEQLRKKMQVQLIHEEAVIAKETSLRERMIVAQQVKVEKEHLQAERDEQLKQEDELNKTKVAQVQEIQDRIDEAKNKVAEDKHRAARDAAELTDRLKAEAQAAAQADLDAKRELIKQIRALEAASVALVGTSAASRRAAEVDLTATANVGLLSEMSIAELQERVAHSKQYLRDLEETKRAEIVAAKRAKDDELQRKVEYVQRARIAASVAGTARSSRMSMNSSGTATPLMRRDGAGSDAGLAASRLASSEEHRKKLIELEQKLQQRRQEKQKLIQGNTASPHKYRVRIKHVPKDPERPPPAPISSSMPDLSVVKSDGDEFAAKAWRGIPARHLSMIKERTGRTQSAPELHPLSVAASGSGDDKDNDTSPAATQASAAKPVPETVALVLGLDGAL
ncbi:hypothetical protein AMAG_08273 [Allomyces macrogynus ATCC 38327]|uniref:Uncharacterized protein n=1 Tax=Allomyces macrogynus (strain ATCC 38327) TaxID=578462 RepID=A0A0L0SKM6_ALLM3|nr:hypothetical protein AMAG_08273 [Allomyces macrogynus ATCC 38327]|eukprot:KNE63106.1 hypothetical protein AMAG_08273 [Allomyces macrogynus ATCC 38327]